jgi:hypothetical protein
MEIYRGNGAWSPNGNVHLACTRWFNNYGNLDETNLIRFSRRWRDSHVSSLCLGPPFPYVLLSSLYACEPSQQNRSVKGE